MQPAAIPAKRPVPPLALIANPPANGADAPLIRGKGTFFDENINLRDGEGTAITARMLEIFDATRPRQRKRSAKALETDKIRLRRILANGMRTHFYRQSDAVLFFAKKDANWYADKPSWMRHGALGEFVKVLAAAGLLRTIPGKLMPWNSKKRSWASSYAVTDDLIAIAEDYGITPDSIELRTAPDELVRLFGPKAKRNEPSLPGLRKGKPIAFAHTLETQNWVDSLQALNAFYREQDIGLALSPAEKAQWIAERNADPERSGSPYRLPELFQTDLYRVFNNGDEGKPTFDEGGRLFGAWWTLCESELRSAISINGRATIELDYGECHPRMLYHQRGVEPMGDLYQIPEVSEYEAAHGLNGGEYRKGIKWLMQVLLNGKGRPDLADGPERENLPPDMSFKEVVGFIKAKHQPIADAFNTGVGLSLMRLESDIALEIVTTAMREGWTALSVHDSFIAPVEYRQRLEALMVETYQRRLRHRPKIKVA